MWIIERDSVGVVAYGRMQRDGVIRTVIPGLALPHDVPDSPALRRWALRRCFPAHGQLTGLGVLWAHGHIDCLEQLNVRTAPGRHVRHWRGPLPVRFHTSGIISAPAPRSEGALADNAFAPLAVSIADALRWSPLDRAIPAAIRALEACNSAGLWDSVASHIGTHRRAQSAWAAIQGVTTEIAQEGRRAPVMRRAS